jgi:hypothetical protein
MSLHLSLDLLLCRFRFFGPPRHVDIPKRPVVLGGFKIREFSLEVFDTHRCGSTPVTLPYHSLLGQDAVTPTPHTAEF